MKEFTELQIWQEAHRLTLLVYQRTKTFPREELFGLRTQLQRAAVAVESNIAEGFGRYSHAEFHQFCNIARGSVAEVQCQLLIARDLGYLSPEAWELLEEQAVSVRRLLHAFMRSLRPS
jgi:four helix bundle protein